MRCSRVRFAFPRPILTLVSVPPPPPHLRNGSGSTSTTTSMDPLGYWLLLVAFARLSSVYFGYFNLWALQVAVYSKRTMSDVHGRTFAVWTAVTCTLCILCALHLDSRPLYLATLTSFVFALLHFLLELLVYKTMTVKNFAAPCFFASVSTVWMFMELAVEAFASEVDGVQKKLETVIVEAEDECAFPDCSQIKDDSNVCAICHEGIILQETGFIKGCDHSYCINCILQWASYKTHPWCPQCRLPFSSLYLYKTLNGSVSDFMLEESVCLLLRAPWYTPVEFEYQNEIEHPPELDAYEEDEEEDYYANTLRIGNRRWGENGYVRRGRIEARPAPARSSSAAQKGQNSKEGILGRRARRAQKRTMADAGPSGSGSR
ncbi:unnamed protein product [Closterium sp. NIES-64]|nr:unnamed protein product [Closterium sp. NIES-64]